MNNLVIPPSPNWYESRILSCAIDNTVIYGSQAEIVVIKPKPFNQPADIRVIPVAHYGRIVSIDTNPNWADSNKLAVSVAEDRIVKLWDIEKLECKSSHNTHTTSLEKVVGATFAGNDKIISASENGLIAIWRLGDSQVTTLKNLFTFKVSVTSISSCPHLSWLAAFGLKSGLVVVTDLRKNGKVLYKLRGHDKSVVSLSWCPTPFNIFPKNMPDARKIITARSRKNNVHDANEADSNNAKDRVSETNSVGTDENEKAESQVPDKVKNLDLTQVEHEVNVDVDKSSDSKEPMKTPKKMGVKPNPWINLTHADDDEIESDPFLQENAARRLITPPTNDFLSECEALKQTILDALDVSTDVVDHVVGNESSLVEIINDESALAESIELDHQNVDLVSDSELDNEVQEIFQPMKEYLLASSARGGSIYIWRAGSDGRMQLELPISGKSYRRTYKSTDKSWITLCWLAPDILLSSSPTGELLQWDLLKFTDKWSTPQKKLIHHDHGNNLFCIAAPINIYQVWEEDNWRSRKNLHAWTLGQDRVLLDTSLLADRCTFVSYPTIGGNVYCLTSSPLDPNRIAVGVGDNTAKVWDLSREHTQFIVMKNLWQKIQSKVFTLAWHPTKEMTLGYGTSEGRVGIINTNNTSKAPTLLSLYFRSSIYKIEWGPIDGNVERLGLYVCGEGKVAIYDINKPLEAPMSVDVASDEHATYISWKPDFSRFAIGTKIGSVSVYNKNLEHLITVYTQHKNIYNLLWHPEATAEDTDRSPYSHWLAIGPSDNSIIICDFTSTNVEGLQSGDTILATLNGHAKPVRCLAWSSYQGATLVSGGEDGIAQVWDVKTKSVISTFTGHNVEPILSVIWSPLDKNYIISGGKDNCIRIWNMSEHPPMSDADLLSLWKTRSKLKGDAKKHSKKDDSDDEPKRIKRDVMLSVTTKSQHSTVLSDCKKLLACSTSDAKSEQTSCENAGALKLFGDRNDMLQLLDIEQTKHAERGKYICNQHLSLWKGDLSQTIKESIKLGNVTPWLINMAPMVSPKLWQEACEVYAQKLIENVKADPIETASYLLACHKVQDAVQVLCTANLYREALAIAKCRLPLSDPIINDVVQKWATFCIVNGSFEIAAECFIVLEKYEDAAKALLKRSDPKLLELAVELAEKTTNDDLISAAKVRCDLFKNETKEGAKLETRIDAILSKLIDEGLQLDNDDPELDLKLDDGGGGDSINMDRNSSNNFVNTLFESLSDNIDERIRCIDRESAERNLFVE